MNRLQKNLGLLTTSAPSSSLVTVSSQKELVKANSPPEALSLVLQGAADVMVGLSIHSYLLTKYSISEIEPIYVMKDLKVEGVTAIRPDAPLLASIFQKTFSTISHEERNNILAKWGWVPDRDEKRISGCSASQ